MTAPSRIAVFHPGTQHSWQTARALQQLGRLEFYATSIFHDPDRWPYRLERLPGPLGARLAREFRRFEVAGIDRALVRSGGAHEWFERLAARAGFASLARRIDRAGNRAFGGMLAREMATPARFAMWGYDNSARAVFERARQNGRACILDVTVGHKRRMNEVLAELRDSWGEWFGPFQEPVSERLLADLDAELAMADVAVVGSAFARRTLIETSPAPGLARKLHVLPYCWDEALFGDQPKPLPVDRAAPVRFLLVGQLHPRKGIHLLLEAISRIPRAQATLTLLGTLLVPERTFARYRDRVTHIPGVPRGEVPAVMAAHDVLVFPSYFEGSALSLLEALASGLGIIQTPMAGNGVTPACGIMLEDMSVDALTDAMMAPVRDRGRLDGWRQAAQVEARNYSFAAYRANIARLLDSARI